MPRDPTEAPANVQANSEEKWINEDVPIMFLIEAESEIKNIRKVHIKASWQGCCQLGGPCARTRRFSCVLVRTAWFDRNLELGCILAESKIELKLNVKLKKYA